MEPHTICIYHGNCADGFGAAWVVRENFRQQQNPAEDMIGEDLLVDFHAGVYQMPPPNVKDKDVIIVDFSYKKDIIIAMLEECKSMVIIDHHASAINDLTELVHPKLTCYFDLEHSGAMLAWFYYFGHAVQPPQLLKHIEDRDLWKFKLPGTREIQANLFSYPYDFDVWDQLMGTDDGIEMQMFQDGGRSIERKHFKDIKELLKVSQRRGIIGGFDVPIANLPYTLSSDAGHEMNIGEPFAACWMETTEGFVFSLRSRFGDKDQDQAVDVSKIAIAYGGGGHKQAAGFKLRKDSAELLKIFHDPVVISSTPSPSDPYLQTK